MDDNSNVRRQRFKPNSLFSIPPRSTTLEPMQDDLPPGTVPNQMMPNRSFPSITLGQFDPYSGGIVSSPNVQRNVMSRVPSGLNFGAQLSGVTSPMDGSNFQTASPVSTSHSGESGRILSTSSSSASLGTPTRMTPEHIIRTYSQESVGKLKIEPNREAFDFVASDLRDCGEIGRGAFGAVNRMIHARTNTEMAVKRIRSTVDEKEQKQLLMDLDVVMRSSDCPYIVKFYGALFWEGDCWICMELMSTSLDNFYRFVYHRQMTRIPEEILGKIAVATVKALDYLKVS
ncbi:unnamed protein product [Clavelina lepadiformis]|uniref:mitogen-activated protein kinase kinase n=1 Tax=Clavelina lepadiformis TaxID=159417 RepID=A0ABP0GFD9_CLALP